MLHDHDLGLRLRPVAPHAVDAAASRGRLHVEPDCPMRTPFQRDRDRIVHATAFRRLNHKTQVFLYHEGDHYRSRLTHSLEVAQIARAIARLLGLDEDLAEALALAHDLGHPPFGHAGERALDRALDDVGGFDHNAQSLAVVTRLERKYSAFDGLNLTHETLEGLVKHNGPVTGANARAGGGPRALLAAIAETGLADALALDLFASAEAQAAAIADDIAWINHDIDDGLRAGLLILQDLAEAPFAGAFVREVLAGAPVDAERRRAFYEVNRRMITAMVAGTVDETRHRIGSLGRQPGSVTADTIRHAGRETVTFPDAMLEGLGGLRRFLFARVYRHPRVVRVMAGAEQIVEDLARRYRRDPAVLPDDRVHRLPKGDDAARARAIGDFIAGMTDRFAIAEHRRLFPSTPELA